MENREIWLKENGFKKKWFVDKSGYWWVKPVKIGEFKGYFYYEERFCQLYIDCFRHQVDDLYTCEDSWLKVDTTDLQFQMRSVYNLYTIDNKKYNEMSEKCIESVKKYNWKNNVGYVTAQHKQAIQEYGLSPYHRKSVKLNINN